MAYIPSLTEKTIFCGGKVENIALKIVCGWSEVL